MKQMICSVRVKCSLFLLHYIQLIIFLPSVMVAFTFIFFWSVNERHIACRINAFLWKHFVSHCANGSLIETVLFAVTVNALSLKLLDICSSGSARSWHWIIAVIKVNVVTQILDRDRNRKCWVSSFLLSQWLIFCSPVVVEYPLCIAGIKAIKQSITKFMCISLSPMSILRAYFFNHLFVNSRFVLWSHIINSQVIQQNFCRLLTPDSKPKEIVPLRQRLPCLYVTLIRFILFNSSSGKKLLLRKASKVLSSLTVSFMISYVVYVLWWFHRDLLCKVQ